MNITLQTGPKKGNTKNGNNPVLFGHDVSINAEGNMILVGQPHYSSNKGRTNAYLYNETRQMEVLGLRLCTV